MLETQTTPSHKPGQSDTVSEQEAHQLLGQAKRLATKIQPKDVGDGIFGRFFRTSKNADRT